MELRKTRYSDLSVKSASKTVTIPVGGGSATTSITLSDFGLSSKIEAILNVRITRKTPIVNDVYEPSYGITSSLDAVGLTLYAGTGTSLTVECTVFGI